MNINVVRIDDRLIHGQIVTKWIKEAKATKIMVVDDVAADNATLQMILKLAVPSGITLEVLSKKAAIERVNNDTTNTNVLLLLRNPKEAADFVLMGFQVDQMIVGNVSNSKSLVGRKKILDYIWVEPDDVNALKILNEAGVELIVKAIPEENGKNAMELIAKKCK